MNIQEKALAYHNAGCNCAQSVLCACESYTGMDEKIARSISAAFGSGMRCGEVCGAVSGALMAIGAACNYDENGGPTGAVAGLSRKVTGPFKEKYEYIRCSDLLRAAKQKRCDEFIGYCAALAEQVILEQKNQ